MEQINLDSGWLIGILISVIFLMVGFIWRDLNNKIKTLFKTHDTFVDKELLEAGVNTQIASLSTSVNVLNADLRKHMDSERVMYGILVGVIVLGFTIMTISMVVIYMNIK